MQIICISRGSFERGKQLAERLAANLGYSCYSREQLSDAAKDAGINLGKLEMAIVRRRPLTELENLEKERFKALTTANLCEFALKKGLVYHGRIAHLQLPGIAHTLRIRTILDPEMRIGLTMQRLRLPREKARIYNEQVDEDRHLWVRRLYNQDWDDPQQYDMVVNLSRTSVDNASKALIAMTQLPEFQTTPVGTRALNDLLLAARSRLAIGADQRTRLMDAKVKAEAGQVLVTYLPQHRQFSKHLQDVLKDVPGIERLVCTVATTNLLWIQEKFDIQSPTLGEILDVATRWDAAIELAQLTETPKVKSEAGANHETLMHSPDDFADNGGILADNSGHDPDHDTDDGVKQTIERLVTVGRAGGYRHVAGGPKDLLDGLDRTVPYSLVIVGNVFLNKEASARKRLSQELVNYISENLRIPVVSAEELKSHYSFGARQWMDTFAFGLITVLFFLITLSNQMQIITFTSDPGTAHRILATACMFVLVPIFAYCYGGFSRNVLKLLKFE